MAATDAYLAGTMTVREEIVGRPLFEVIPGTRHLQVSFDTVLRNEPFASGGHAGRFRL